MRICIIILSLLLSVTIIAAERPIDKKTRILFVLDASGSMKKSWNGGAKKWDIAKKILIEKSRELQEQGVDFGLRVYGHQSAASTRDCKDSRLEVTIGKNKAEYIELKLEKLKPKGITPIAYSLEKCAADFPDKNARNVVILITDGDESCGGDPCAITLEMQKKGAILKPFVIGIAMPDYIKEKYQCMGEFFDAAQPTDFDEQLDKVFTRVLAKTTVQVDLLDQSRNAIETNANMTFYDRETGIAKYNFYHTLNHQGLPDTLPIDPAFNYDLVVHTLPPLKLEGIKLEPNQHNTIPVDAAQGFLKIEVEQPLVQQEALQQLKVLVRQDEAFNTMHILPFNVTEKYLTGTYDLELLTIPRISIKDVQVQQSQTTNIKIPTPGIVTIRKSSEVYGGIFTMDNNKMEKVHEFQTNKNTEKLAIQPGKYRIVYRSKHSKSMHTTVDKELEVNSNKVISITL